MSNPSREGDPPQSSFLAGVRVLEITGALAGPYCTTILADLGAEVIKVEPVAGDGMRRRVVGPRRRPIPFDLVHRGKGSLAVDIKRPEGQAIVRRLAAGSDILVENFRVGALALQGLGYDDLKHDCPNLVYCSISGFGQYGPMRDAKGIDLIAQAYGGLMSVTGSADGELAKAGYPVSDIGTGMWGAIGILAALQRVRGGGGGAHIDVSLADAVASWSVWEVADYLGTSVPPGPLGTAHRLAAPYQAFACGDGQTLVIGAVDRAWPELCRVLDLDLVSDPRFATEYERFVHREELARLLQVRFGSAPRDVWMDRLRDAGVPCGPVNTIDALIDDPHYAAREMFPHDEERFGHPTIVNTPIVSDGAPRATRRAPALGVDTARLLRELGYEEHRIERLAADGVLGLAPAEPSIAGKAAG
ncbi:CaiB/BaiF CoA transferase family protein [Actinomadura welshii]|uniref:CaiB/BaiF CoA transferase family protein n=1 Tax=Actinomadura welshii TaxID=3103817 RepID=UPI0003AD6887|nr:CoA transferase [Actinomadura madurae]